MIEDERKFWAEAQIFISEIDQQEYIDLRKAGLTKEEATREILDKIHHQI